MSTKKNYDIETRGRNPIEFKKVEKEDGEWKGLKRAARESGYHADTIKKAGLRGVIRTEKKDNRIYYFMEKLKGDE